MADDKPLLDFVVLAVEDDTLILEAATFLIADALGCIVLSATSGDDALRIIDSGARVDLLFADIVMPNMDGLTLARLVKERAPQLPIVLTTGLPAAVHLATENGAIPLIKPYSLRQLEAVFCEQLHVECRATPDDVSLQATRGPINITSRARRRRAAPPRRRSTV
jgi:CheY-like chemotaxis protein